MFWQRLTPEQFGFVLALFYRRQLRLFNFTGYKSPSSRHSPLPPTTLPRWLLPDTDSRTGKTKRGPNSTSTPFLSVWHQTGRSLRKNPSVFPRSPPFLVLAVVVSARASTTDP